MIRVGGNLSSACVPCRGIHAISLLIIVLLLFAKRLAQAFCILAIHPRLPRIGLRLAASHHIQWCAGINGRETAITPALLRAGRFGKIGTLPVQGAVYAHPLVVPGLSIGGRTVTGVIVATQDNFVRCLTARPWLRPSEAQH